MLMKILLHNYLISIIEEEPHTTHVETYHESYGELNMMEKWAILLIFGVTFFGKELQAMEGQEPSTTARPIDGQESSTGQSSSDGATFGDQVRDNAETDNREGGQTNGQTTEGTNDGGGDPTDVQTAQTTVQAGNQTGDQAGSQTGDQAGSQTDDQTGEGSGDQMDGQTGDTTDDQTGDQTNDQTGDKTGDQMADQSGDEMGDQTGDQTGNRTGDQTGVETDSQAVNQTNGQMGDKMGDQTGDQTGDKTDGQTEDQTGDETGYQTGNHTYTPANNQTGEQTGDNINGQAGEQMGGQTGDESVDPSGDQTFDQIGNQTEVHKGDQTDQTDDDHTDFQTGNQTNSQTGDKTGGQTGDKTGDQTSDPTSDQMGNQTDVQTGDQTEGQTADQSGNQTEVHKGDQTGDQTDDDHTDFQTGNQTNSQMGDKTGGQTGDQTGDHTGDQTGDQTHDKPGDQTDGQTGEQTDSQTGDKTGDQTGDPTSDQTDDNTDVQTGVQTNGETGDPGDDQTADQTGDQTGGQTGDQTDEQTDDQIHDKQDVQRGNKTVDETGDQHDEQINGQAGDQTDGREEGTGEETGDGNNPETVSQDTDQTGGHMGGETGDREDDLDNGQDHGNVKEETADKTNNQTSSDDQGNGQTEEDTGEQEDAQGDPNGEQAGDQTHDQTDEEERDGGNVQTGDQTDDDEGGQAGDGTKDAEQEDGDNPKDEQTNDQTDDQQEEGVTGDQSHTHENLTESHNRDEDFEDESGPLYRLPRLVLDEHMFTLSYDEECTPFRLTYTIPMPQEGAQQTDGTEEEEEAESERGGDGETREVISYDDFGAFRRAEQSLPEMPFLLNGKQAKLAKGSSNMIRIDNTNFTTNRELVISGKFCGLGSQLLLLCPTIDGRSRIRTDDAPSGKCHNISVFVEAPIISSARLTNEGDGIIIFFNKNVAIKDLRKCSSIFDKPTINKLGENAVCKWKDGKNLIVGLGCDATITTGSSITLKPDRIKAARSLFSHTASGTINVLAPNDPKPPKAVIDGRPKVPACGQFALSGRPSTGGRSCGLTYEWALVSSTEDVDSRLTDKIQEANDANNDRVVSTTEALPEVIPHTFRLTVTNKLGLSNSTEFTIRKSNVREPWLEIQKSGNIKGTKVSANKKFGLIAQFTFEQGTGCEKLVASRAEYQWSVEGVEFDEDALRKRGLRFLPSNLVGASDITATVTVTYGSPTDQKTKSASVTLTVVKAPLRARIKGGDSITVGTASDSVDLDCSFSNDPSYQGDEPDPGLEFRWGCWDETSILTCDLPSSQEDTDVAILTIEPSLLTIDKTYSISCYVNKAGFEEVHDSVKVSVTEGSPPRISLALLGSNEGSYKPGQDVEIRVMFNGNYSETVLDDLRGGLDGIGDPQNTVIIDKTREDQETAESDSQDSSSDKPYQLTISKKRTRYTVLLKIDKSILTPGSQYGLGVKVVSESSEGLAEIDFNVYDRVTGCTFEFGENGDYEDTDTDVTYEVSGCSVDSLEGLTYRAFTQFRSRKRLLGETSQDSTFTVDHEVLDIVKKRVEAGDAVDFKVGVKVCNTTSGVCSEFLKNATYAVGTLSEEELDEEKQQIQDLKLEGRSVEGLKKANRAQKARASQTTGVERKKRAAPDCDRVLLDLQYELLVEATSDEANYNYNPGDVLGMLQADTDVPITCLTLEQQRSTLASTKRVLESARDLEDRLPPETVDGVRQQLEDAKMTYPDAFFFSENRDIFGLLTKGMSKNMALGEKVSSFGESMFISVDYTLNTDTIQISRGDGNIVFLGGDDIKDRFDTSWVGCGCEDCVGILLESIVFRGQDYVGGESHDSDVFRLQFFSPCADSTDPIEVRDLSDPIRFWYPVSVQPNDRPVCSFLDQGTDEWSQEGLKAALDGTDVRCETNHTTEYVVDLINENGQSTSTIPEVTDTTTRGDDNNDDDDDDGHIDIPGINGLIGLGVGVVVGIVVAVIVVLAAVIILVVVVVKHVNKPKMIIEPVVKA